MQPSRLDVKTGLIGLHMSLNGFKERLLDWIRSIWRIGGRSGKSRWGRTRPLTREVRPELLPTHEYLYVKGEFAPICAIEDVRTARNRNDTPGLPRDAMEAATCTVSWRLRQGTRRRTGVRTQVRVAEPQSHGWDASVWHRVAGRSCVVWDRRQGSERLRGDAAARALDRRGEVEMASPAVVTACWRLVGGMLVMAGWTLNLGSVTMLGQTNSSIPWPWWYTFWPATGKPDGKTKSISQDIRNGTFLSETSIMIGNR